jgi:hypothetical protein
MATTWPDTAELAQILNVDNVADWQTTLGRVRAAAIEYVKLRRGSWVEGTDHPDDMLAQAALRMAEMMAQRPTATTDELGHDPTFNRLMFGHRRRYGIA